MATQVIGTAANTPTTSSSSKSSGLSNNNSQVSTKGNDFKSVDLNQFLKLLVTELQNQDPMNPTSNAEFLQQVSQIRQIGATNQLSDSLTSLSIGQELSTASSLIGKKINALTDDAKDVTGLVDRVTLEKDPKDETKRKVRVHVGDQTVDMNNIRQVLADAKPAA